MTLADALAPHPHARAVLRSAIPPHGAPSHAYLFHGPAGSGKARAARAFAAELLAEGSPDPDRTRARVERNAHPDLTWVVRSGAADMRVVDIAEPVVGAVSHRPFEAQRRVFVLEDADTLNDEAAAKLLKTLEEPPAYAHLLLLTAHPRDLLDTVRSRCQSVRFDAPSPARLEELIAGRGVSPEQAHACARLSLGDADRALALALGQGPALRHAAELTARACLTGAVTGRPWEAILASAKERGAQARTTIEEGVAEEAERLPDRERRTAVREGEETAKRAERRARTGALDEGLRLIGLWLRDVACIADGAQDVVHATDRLEALRADSEGHTSAALRAGVDLVDATRSSLSVNVGEDLALEALVARLVTRLAPA
ncbi:unannotated protein [freshwater metagenome]|uniref:Unannotated protein n=1 Tax=freshwater metagenome TaxID=449393 RepID=A0A6J7JEJ2_9ZZZZ